MEAAGAEASPATGDNRFSDWLRFNLLAVHGGVWIDSTIILTAPIELLVNETAEISGLHIEGFLLETYFVAAVPGGKTITDWAEEFSRLCAMGDAEYDRYLVGLKSRGVEPLNGRYADCDWAEGSRGSAVLHWFLHAAVACVNLFVGYTQHYLHPCGEHHWMRYLKSTVALNAVIGTTGRDPRPLWDRLGISAQSTLETLSLANQLNDWDTRRVAKFLLTRQSAGVDLRAARGVKLRSKERRQLEDSGRCEEGSFVCRAQRLANFTVFEELPEAAEL